MKVLLALLLAAPLQDGDLPKRVRQLVEQLQSDEIQAADDAVAALIALGPPALEAIRAELKKAGGDTKLRLEEAVRKIDRNVKRGRALGTPLLVSLEIKDKPVADALEEFKKATGQPITFKDLPADKVTVSFDRTPFWEALDRLCKAHGGVMWTVEEKEIVVAKGRYRDLPKVFRGNLVVFFSRLTSEHRFHRGAAQPHTSLEGGLAWTRGSNIPREKLLVEQMVDDQGTDLLAKRAGFSSSSFFEEEAVEPELIVKQLDHSEMNVLHDRAAKLARLKGSVVLEYVLETRKILTFDKPAGKVGVATRAGSLTVTIRKFNLTGEDAGARVSVQTANLRDRIPVRASGFRLIDSKGAAHPATGWVDEEVDEDTGKVEYDIDLDWTLAEKTEIVSLEFTLPTDLEEIAIPFDFKDLPLK